MKKKTKKKMMMTMEVEVRLHVYDVTNSGSDKTNSTILQINKIFKDGIGLGGIFHSAVQVSLSLSLSLSNGVLLWQMRSWVIVLVLEIFFL